jgi:dTDP-N-acetylfucosamine:lipid II N-acetylfucosaminyltransferase
MKIIHLALDEKFIKSAYWQFEKAYPNSNFFFITIPEDQKELEYVDLEENIFIIKSRKEKLNIVNNVSDYDLVIFHGMFPQNSYYLNRIKKTPDLKVLWLFFGGEIHDNPLTKLNVGYGDETLKLIHPNVFRQLVNKANKLLLPYYINFKNPEFSSILTAAKKVDYLGVIMKEEYDLLKKKEIIKSNSNWFNFSYYPIEFIFKGMKDSIVNGNNIMIGNSATPSNNHAEVLIKLKKIGLKNQKIFIPLSYGDKIYANKVKRFANFNFMEQVFYLDNFLPLQEYNKIVQNCGFVIMNHSRQQAVGNIFSSLWLGAKLFMKEESTVFKYLKRINILVFSIESDMKTQDDFELLTKHEIQFNRKILLNEIGEKKLRKDLKFQLEAIFNDN